MQAEVDPIVHYWLGRAAAEYHSAARAMWVGHQLVLIGAQPALVRRALRVASDELTHAQLALTVARAAGFDGELELDRTVLTSAVPVATNSVENVLIPHVIAHFCIAETVAARLFAAAIGPNQQPSVAQALRKFVADEVRHRDFGWLCLAWLKQTGALAPLADHRVAVVVWWPCLSSQNVVTSTGAKLAGFAARMLGGSRTGSAASLIVVATDACGGSQAPSAARIGSLAADELGHWLGLYHSDGTHGLPDPARGADLMHSQHAISGDVDASFSVAQRAFLRSHPDLVFP